MSTVVQQSVFVSLASIEVSQRMQVRRILSESLHQLCAALGLEEGTIVQCCASSPWRVYLRNSSGRTVALERDQARYIAAERIAETYRFP